MLMKSECFCPPAACLPPAGACTLPAYGQSTY